MASTLTRTKVLVPRRASHILTRRRLLDLLYDILDYRLFLIAAPAGYGKTSALVDWADEAELPFCWYALDPRDRDPHQFVAYLIAALAQQFPAFGRASETVLQNMPRDLDVRRMVQVLVNDAYEHIPEHFVLVLDDYHLVNANPTISALVNAFVRQMDENGHVVLVSRTLLDIPDLPLLVARSQAGGLGFEALAFQREEVQALILQNYHLTVPQAEAEALVRETEGWITGLLLSAQTMPRGMADRARAARVSGVGLYDYMAQQVLDQQPPALRDFLLRSSPLEEFDADLCRAVLGDTADWAALIAQAQRRHLFVIPVGDAGTWLRYHHLFGEFLQARLAEEQPEIWRATVRRLAAVYAERGRWELAHAQYERLDDAEATAALIERAGSALVRQGRAVLLARWIDALPASVIETRPALLSLRGFAAIETGEVRAGLPYLDRAAEHFARVDDEPQLARTLVRRAVTHRLLANYTASLDDAEAALALVGESEALRPIRAEGLRAKGVGLARLGRAGEAIPWQERSLEAYRALDDEHNEAMSLMELGLTHMNIGHYRQAIRCYQGALAHWERIEDVVRLATLYNNLGVLHHLRGDYPQAVHDLEAALACARQAGNARGEALALASLGDLYADLDAHAAARRVYEQARHLAQQIGFHFLQVYLGAAELKLALASGDRAGARQRRRDVEHLVQESTSNYDRGVRSLAQGRLALASDEVGRAIDCLAEAARCFDRGQQAVEGLAAHMALATAHHRHGDDSLALRHLERALVAYAHLESQHPLIRAGRENRALLEACQGHNELGARVTRLLERITDFEATLPGLRRRLRRQISATPFAAPHLSFQALGAAEVLVDAESVTGRTWQSQSARDLLFCLLAHPDGLTQEQVGVLFWPEKAPPQLKLHFKKTVYRLRRVLGTEAVLFGEGRYRFNRALDYDYDVETFLETLAVARNATEGAPQAEAYRKAVAAYAGPYLPAVDGEWVTVERERLWRAYVEAALALLEHQVAAGAYEAALAVCQHALAQDPCLEEVHRYAMRAHAALGDRGALARQYARCCDALREDLDVEPAPQTQALYQRLTYEAVPRK